jgi:hypothetical protein
MTVEAIRFFMAFKQMLLEEQQMRLLKAQITIERCQTDLGRL